ncbi:hypothetical protein [Allochromatium palmeri]|uniref:Uncharacterized protein n=1 Tax=Allochromatium palmeri TaxID=231048 RepID=A0A6N8EJM1_9GAMM|nr:hypothetical protein [Allochromatium palmeri]MTW22707.1 hypothetical protein [Allochromatium palmeri]
MSEIGLQSNLPPTGATKAYTPPRVGSESDSTTAASNVSSSTPGSGSTSMPPTTPVGSSGETVSISSGAYSLQQTNNTSTEAAGSTTGSGMNSQDAMALLQRVQSANPQSLFQAQAGIGAQQAGLLLA